jgi:8-oxo-dGTP pyrophosphatase MutT (NUDIX family)
MTEWKSDHRMHVAGLLERYLRRYPGEVEVADRVEALCASRADCLQRTCLEPGHVTGSAWIVSLDGSRCLLTHHRKLDRWLQLGGHADGETHIESVALREAEEESGISSFLMPPWRGELVPLDLDVHVIPARGAEPAHEHHDFRFLLVADASLPIHVSEESHDVRWVDVERLRDFTDEESVLRLARKVDEMYRSR